MNQSLFFQPKPRITTTGLILLGALLLFLILQVGLTWLAPRMDQTWSQLLVAAVMLTIALLLEKLFWGRRPPEALHALGFARATWRTIGVALILSLLLLLFFPIFAWLTGATVRLRPDWWWIAIGALAVNGIAEETLFRGFVFGHLRLGVRLRVSSAELSPTHREGQGKTFRQAALLSLPIFVAVHLILFVQNPFVLGLLATLIALVAALPLAYLFEQAGFSLWPTVLLHVVVHVIRFVEISEPFYRTAVLAWMILQIGAPFLTFAFRGNLQGTQRLFRINANLR